MKILITEDDKNIRQALNDILSKEGYHTIEAKNGKEGIEKFIELKPDFVLMDIMMPEQDGYSACREIRKMNEEVPIVFISAKSEEIDRVLGLELGADDYIMKPFGSREVVARIRAITRRVLKSAKAEDKQCEDKFIMGDLTVLPKELRASRNGEAIELSLRDVQILTVLHKYQGEVLSRDKLFDECWGRNYLPSSRTLDQHISRLRKLVEIDPANPVIVKTVHGIGYRFD